ncbi:hypothetical protein AB837_00563 [bacterium AB1]|nr:hypothetical protein AB837_00563 [bacterium AB1]
MPSDKQWDKYKKALIDFRDACDLYNEKQLIDPSHSVYEILVSWSHVHPDKFSVETLKSYLNECCLSEKDKAKLNLDCKKEKSEKILEQTKLDLDSNKAQLKLTNNKLNQKKSTLDNDDQETQNQKKKLEQEVEALKAKISIIINKYEKLLKRKKSDYYENNQIKNNQLTSSEKKLYICYFVFIIIAIIIGTIVIIHFIRKFNNHKNKEIK